MKKRGDEQGADEDNRAGEHPDESPASAIDNELPEVSQIVQNSVYHRHHKSLSGIFRTCMGLHQ